MIGGDIIALRSVLTALNNERPIVLVPEAGGAGKALYEACCEGPRAETSGQDAPLTREMRDAINQCKAIKAKVMNEGRANPFTYFMVQVIKVIPRSSSPSLP